MATVIQFTVYGKPVPQGSMSSFNGHVTSANKRLKPWRQQLSETAMALRLTPIGKHKPVRIALDFYFERPASVSEKKRPFMTVKPDGDKLMRAVFDAMTGTVVTDDAQFVDFRARKFYGIPERVEIKLEEI